MTIISYRTPVKNLNVLKLLVQVTYSMIYRTISSSFKLMDSDDKMIKLSIMYQLQPNSKNTAKDQKTA